MNTVNVYNFNELSKEAQQAAIEDQREFMDMHFDTDYYEEMLHEAGFEDAEIYYSVSYSQGDGASFKSGVNLQKFIKINELQNEFPLVYECAKDRQETTFQVTRFGRYYHHMTMGVELLDDSLHYNDVWEEAMEIASDEANCDDMTDTEWDNWLENYTKENANQQEAYNQEVADIEPAILSIARELAQKIHKLMQGQYDYIISDENIKEHLEVNGYQFLADGRAI